VSISPGSSAEQAEGSLALRWNLPFSIGTVVRMLFKYGIVIVLLVLPPLLSAQSSERQIQTEGELVSALCRLNQDQQSREQLLKSHEQLVDSQLWKDLNDRAAAFYALSPAQSLAIYEVAIQVAAQLRDQRSLATTYYNIGRTYSGLNQFPAAIGAYEKSREYFAQAGLERDEIYVLGDLGALYFIQEDYEKAKEYSEQSISIADKVKTDSRPGAWPDDFGRARALQTLAEIDTRNGDHEHAIQKLQESLALYQRLNSGPSSSDPYILRVYATLGRVYPEIGDSAAGLLYLRKALEIAKAQSDTTMIASLHNDIGVLYLEQEDYAQANAQFGESLKIYLAEKNQREEARVLLNLGVVDQRRANYDDALRYFRGSLEAATVTDIAEVQIAADEGIGVVLTAKRDFHGATEALDKGLAIAKKLSDKTRQTEILWRMAQVCYEMGNYSQSAAFAESAIALARASRLSKLLYLATTTLGESYAAQKKVEIAIRTLTQAVEEGEAMRDQVAGREEERQLFFEGKVTPYQVLMDLLIQQGRSLDALLYAERAKGRVLLDVLSGGRAELTKALTPAERENVQHLNRNISNLNEQIRKAETNNSASLESLYPRLDAARLEYQSFQDAAFVTHPELNVRSGRTATIDRSGIDGLTRNSDSAYLEYVVSKERVYLFVLTATKATNGPQLKAYPLTVTPAELVRKVDQFHEELANLNPDYSGNAHELYSLLVAPAAEQLKGVETLCIVPDGVLWNLPFQALMPADEHYLLEDHSIYYAPSLSVLREMSEKRRGGRNANSLIAFGNPVIGKDEQRQVDLCPLPEAENEVGSIAKTAGLEAKRVFIGRDASEKTFKNLAPGFSVIHLATHGVLDNRNPLYSHLLLTRTEGDAENDGLLEAREIMEMRLDADLAVLSACDTANGKIAPGEGVMGMSWAFFVAGCRSMLVSEWKVNSSSTSQLMVNFYGQSDLVRIRSGGANASALRAAALQLMKDDRYRHPFFWAGFVLVGVNQTQ
jgi:CHAT domain-containing protein/Tfp pilus assembly protein PilF